MNIVKENKLFRILLMSNSLGLIGITLFDIVFTVYANSFPNPTLAVSIVSVTTTIPYILSFVMGYLADKTKDKIKMMMTIRIIQVCLFGVFSLLAGLSYSWWVFSLILAINFVSDFIGGIRGIPV